MGTMLEEQEKWVSEQETFLDKWSDYQEDLEKLNKEVTTVGCNGWTAVHTLQNSEHVFAGTKIWQEWGLDLNPAKQKCSANDKCIAFSWNPDDLTLFYSRLSGVEHRD